MFGDFPTSAIRMEEVRWIKGVRGGWLLYQRVDRMGSKGVKAAVRLYFM